MNITASVGTTAVLALTISCARSQVRPAESQPQASTAAAPTAAGVAGRTEGLAQYVGQYQINGNIVTIRAKGDALVRTMSGQGEEVLRPVGKSRFKVGMTPVEFEFRPDPSGGMTLIMYAGQHQARGTRMR